MTDDPRLESARADLAEALGLLVARHGISRALVDEFLSVEPSFRRHVRAQGIDFPQMTLLLLPRFGAAKLFRRDLEGPGIQRVVINLTVEFPTITAREIAEAVAAAWPEYARKVNAEARRKG